MSNEITKISEATNTSLYPDRTAPRSLKVDGESVALTFEQRSMYQKAYGDAYASAVSSLMNDKNYKAMPDSMKAEILKQAKDTATEQARDSLGIGYEMKASAQKILETSGADRNNAMIAAAVKAQHYMSDDTKKQLSNVEKQFGGADYIGLSEELINSAKEKVSDYYSKVEAAKYGDELSQTDKDLADKSSNELAKYFMDKTIESRYTDANKSGTKADEYLKAYRQGEINDAIALAVLSDKEVKAYDRFGKSAKVTPEMALQAANAHAGMKDVKDEDGKVTSSAQDQFDAWLDKQSWTDDQKSAIRMGFYSDSVKTYGYLADQLRKGNIKTSDAKSELTTSYQAGWSHNVKDTGAEMADYIEAIVEFEQAQLVWATIPTRPSRRSGLRSDKGVSMVQKIRNVLYITLRGVNLEACTNLSFKIVQGDSFSKSYTPTVSDATHFTVEIPKADADSLTVRPARCQLTYTDENGNSRATEIAVVDVEELL